MSTLERPRVDDLPSLDEEPPCHAFEKTNAKPCGHTATLVMRMHDCWSIIVCEQCWQKMMLATSRACKKGGFFECLACHKTSTKLEELVWKIPL